MDNSRERGEERRVERRKRRKRRKKGKQKDQVEEYSNGFWDQGLFLARFIW
jgi:hypothetical protein